MQLLDFIETIEERWRKAKRNYLDMQPGDVPRTFASADLLERLTGYRPHTSLEEGVAALVDGLAIIAALTENWRFERRPLDALRGGLPVVAVGAARLLLLVG